MVKGPTFLSLPARWGPTGIGYLAHSISDPRAAILGDTRHGKITMTP